MTDEKQEFDELPELPEMSELPDLPELGELGELEVEPEVPVTTATASPLRRDEPSAEPAARGEALLQEEPSAPAALPAPESAPKAPLPSGETPPLRELDKAPRHLRMAALIVAAGTLLPFMGPGTGAVAGAVGRWLRPAVTQFFTLSRHESSWSRRAVFLEPSRPSPKLKGYPPCRVRLRLSAG